jgi:cell shape-determining protein MreC
MGRKYQKGFLGTAEYMRKEVSRGQELLKRPGTDAGFLTNKIKKEEEEEEEEEKEKKKKKRKRKKEEEEGEK